MISQLRDGAHLEQLLASPNPVWIFKHSNTCPISTAAHEEVSAYLSAHAAEVAAMVVVQSDRPLSNLIAQRLARVHQSPQLFLMAAGAIAWSASHWSITATAMASERARLG